MKHSFKIIGTSNGIAYLKSSNGSFKAFADGVEYIGVTGDRVELLEKDYVPEGDLAEFQKMSDAYNAADSELAGNTACLDGQN